MGEGVECCIVPEIEGVLACIVMEFEEYMQKAFDPMSPVFVSHHCGWSSSIHGLPQASLCAFCLAQGGFAQGDSAQVFFARALEMVLWLALIDHA